MNIGRKPFVKRHSKWPALSKRFLKGKSCAVCGRKKQLIAHHRYPVHLFPELELNEGNLLPLCESRQHNCHLWIGHVGHWRSYAPDAADEAGRIAERLRTRLVCPYKP